MKVALDTLKLIVGFAGSPAGIDMIVKLLGTANPGVGLLATFGVRLLALVLPEITTESVTDEQITAALAAKGIKVDPFDPATLFAMG